MIVAGEAEIGTLSETRLHRPDHDSREGERNRVGKGHEDQRTSLE